MVIKKRKKEKCKMCGHAMADHGINIAGDIYCTKDGCNRWIYCHRKEKRKHLCGQ